MHFCALCICLVPAEASKIIFIDGVFLCMGMQTVLGIILGYFALDVLFFLAKKFGG